MMEAGRILGGKWREMKQEEKDKWLTDARAEMQAWKATHPAESLTVRAFFLYLLVRFLLDSACCCSDHQPRVCSV